MQGTQRKIATYHANRPCLRARCGFFSISERHAGVLVTWFAVTWLARAGTLLREPAKENYLILRNSERSRGGPEKIQDLSL
jgi:hypothetical protein